jgi:biopolymer transport protein ExbB
MGSNLAEWFRSGGFFMWPILVCAVVGAAVAVERLVYIFLRAAINAPVFMAAIQRHVLDGDIDAAVRLCNAEAGAVLPRVLKAGLVRADRPDAEVRDALEEASLEVYPLVNRRLSYLPMIANVATLLGLLGTIQGLIESFQAVGEADATERSAALAHGIAVSMNATFAGLTIAVPVLVIHAIVAARANGILDEIDHYALRLTNLLNAVRRERPQGGAPVLPFPGP